MAVKPRSLISNSVGSVLASGMLIFSTILIPAVLARALTRAQYDSYAIVLASLPLILVLPQSMRTVGASQLALAVAKYEITPAMGAYRRFCLMVTGAHIALAIVGIESYVVIGHAPIDHGILRMGLYCVLAYTLGLILVGFVIAPAAAQRDFRPDNIAKVWPGLFQLAGIAIVWRERPAIPLMWIFTIYVASSWSIALGLLAQRKLHSSAFDAEAQPDSAPVGQFVQGLRGVVWWNLTAFLATTAAVMIVAVTFPTQIVPFSIAISLLGMVSAGLVAVSAPVTVHAAAGIENSVTHRRRFFLLVNTAFQLYIVVAAVVIVMMPTSLYALWLTAKLAGEVKTFTLLLLPASVIRLLTMNFTIFVMSAGRQHTLWLSPMVEAVLSVAGCLLFGGIFGIVGIPIALTLSAFVRLAMTLMHDERVNRSALALMSGDVLLSGLRLARGHHANLS